MFQCGLQIERGYVKAPPSSRECELRSDWDWHRLVKGLRPASPIERELRRLIEREGFCLYVGSWETDTAPFSKENFPGVVKLRRLLGSAPRNHWAGFQLFYPMTEEEVRSATGVDLVESMLCGLRRSHAPDESHDADSIVGVTPSIMKPAQKPD